VLIVGRAAKNVTTAQEIEDLRGRVFIFSIYSTLLFTVCIVLLSLFLFFVCIPIYIPILCLYFYLYSYSLFVFLSIFLFFVCISIYIPILFCIYFYVSIHCLPPPAKMFRFLLINRRSYRMVKIHDWLWIPSYFSLEPAED